MFKVRHPTRRVRLAGFSEGGSPYLAPILPIRVRSVEYGRTPGDFSTQHVMRPKTPGAPAKSDLRDRLDFRWPTGRTASPPKRELILTPLNATYKGRGSKHGASCLRRACTSGIDRRSRTERIVRRETNVKRPNQPRAVPIRGQSESWITVSGFALTLLHSKGSGARSKF